MKDSDYTRLSGRVIILLMFLLAIMPRGPVRADVGLPPVSPSGSDLGVAEGERTNVRMVEEEVNLTIETTTEEGPSGYHMRGKVEAVFRMRNLGSAEEALDVWFPLTSSARYVTMFPLVPDAFVQDFQIWADGHPKQIESVRVKMGGRDDPDREIHWASFPITFPAGKDVNVRVTYTIYPSGWRPFGGFEYILETGASWNGTIGKAVVKVHLPFSVTKENVSQSGRSLLGEPLAPQPAGYVIQDNVIRWEFTDLEPGAQDNIYVDVLEPQRYQDLVRARSRAAAEPGSADAQVALAKATAGAILVLKGVNQNGGGTELAEEVKAAYRRALELAPDREDILVGYVNWLMASGAYSSLMWGGGCPAEACELLDRGVKLYPNNPDLIIWDKEIQSMRAEATFQVQYEQTSTAIAEGVLAKYRASTAAALTETARPTVTPTLPASVTPRPTGAAEAFNPTPSSETAAAPRAQPGLIILGLALVFIAVAALILRPGGIARPK